MAQPIPPEMATSNSTTLGIAVLSFGLIIILMIGLVLLKRQRGFGNMTVKLIGLTIIITASIFLIVTGYSENQIAPVIGLLGTIAGYLLGSSDKSSTNNAQQ